MARAAPSASAVEFGPVVAVEPVADGLVEAGLFWSVLAVVTGPAGWFPEPQAPEANTTTAVRTRARETMIALKNDDDLMTDLPSAATRLESQRKSPLLLAPVCALDYDSIVFRISGQTQCSGDSVPRRGPVRGWAGRHS